MKLPESCRTSCSRHVPQCYPQRSQRAPTLPTRCRKVAHQLLIRCSVRRDSERSWSNFGRVGPTSVKFRPPMTNIGKRRANFGRSGPNLANISQVSASVGQLWLSFGRYRPISANVRPHLTNFGGPWPILAVRGQHLARFGSDRPTLFLSRPSFAGHGQLSGNV